MEVPILILGIRYIMEVSNSSLLFIASQNGETALAIACGMGHLEVVELLKSCTIVSACNIEIK